MNDDVSFMDLKTGAIKVKKPKKEKSPAEEAMGELKKIDKKILTMQIVFSSILFWASMLIDHIVHTNTRDSTGSPRLKGIINDLTAVQLDMKEHNVRNSAELVPCWHFVWLLGLLDPPMP